MNLEKLGEDGLIRIIRRMAGPLPPGVKAGIGDDAAVIQKDPDSFLLAAADMLVENVHFTRAMSFFDIGHKAAGANLSDIAAMGGKPLYLLACAGIGEGVSSGDAESLYEGMLSHAREYGAALVGGDTSRSPGGLVVDVFMIGEASAGNLCLRSGARPGDSVFVTGTLGNSALALKRGEYFPVKPRLAEAGILLELAKPSAMMDISDGLALDLKRLCASSRAGARIFRDRIPIASGASFETAVSGGEDFELLFTAPAEKARGLVRAFPEKTGVGLSLIGEILPEEEGVCVVDGGGREEPLEGGYEHF